MKGGRIVRETPYMDWIIMFLSGDNTVFDQYRIIEARVLNGFLRNSVSTDSNLALQHERGTFVENYRRLSNDSKRSPENTTIFDRLVKCRDDIAEIIRLRDEGMRQKTIIGPKTLTETSKQKKHEDRRWYWERILEEIEPILEETRIHNERANAQRAGEEVRRKAEADAIKEQQELRRIEREMNPESSHELNDEDVARYLNEQEQRDAFKEDLLRGRREEEAFIKQSEVPKSISKPVPTQVKKVQTKRVPKQDGMDDKFLEEAIKRTAKEERLDKTMDRLVKWLEEEKALIKRYDSILEKYNDLGPGTTDQRLKANAKKEQLKTQLKEVEKTGVAADIDRKKKEITVHEKVVAKLLEDEATVKEYDKQLAEIDATLASLKQNLLESNHNAENLQKNIDNPKFNLCFNPDCCKEGVKECSRCKNARYCGTDCQSIHWPTHKPFCVAIRKGGRKTKRNPKITKTRKRIKIET